MASQVKPFQRKKDRYGAKKPQRSFFFIQQIYNRIATMQKKQGGCHANGDRPAFYCLQNKNS